MKIYDIISRAGHAVIVIDCQMPALKVRKAGLKLQK